MAYISLAAAPGDSRTVPAADDDAAWQAALAALKTDQRTKSLLLSDLLRTCSTSASDSGSLRGAVRFETRLRPSAGDWASYKAGGTAWMNLPGRPAATAGRHIVEDVHGGRLSVESALGHGSTFIVTLPGAGQTRGEG